jgi:hypothetical protein
VGAKSETYGSSSTNKLELFFVQKPASGLNPVVRGMGSERGADRAAAMYSMIVTAKMNGLDPQAWLTDVLARIAAHP